MSEQLTLDDEENLNFEQAIQQLDKIANKLESGSLNLEESINLFEEGMRLSNKCNQFLNDAEKKITKLVNDNGNIKEENFDIQSENN